MFHFSISTCEFLQNFHISKLEYHCYFQKFINLNKSSQYKFKFYSILTFSHYLTSLSWIHNSTLFSHSLIIINYHQSSSIIINHHQSSMIVINDCHQIFILLSTKFSHFYFPSIWLSFLSWFYISTLFSHFSIIIKQHQLSSIIINNYLFSSNFIDGMFECTFHKIFTLLFSINLNFYNIFTILK